MSWKVAKNKFQWKIIFSFGITSLFASVSISKAVGHQCEFASEKTIDIGVPVDKMGQALFICIQNICYKSNRGSYRQKDGEVMKSPPFTDIMLMISVAWQMAPWVLLI